MVARNQPSANQTLAPRISPVFGLLRQLAKAEALLRRLSKM